MSLHSVKCDIQYCMIVITINNCYNTIIIFAIYAILNLPAHAVFHASNLCHRQIDQTGQQKTNKKKQTHDQEIEFFN